MDPASDCIQKGSFCNPTLDSLRVEEQSAGDEAVTLNLKRDAKNRIRDFYNFCNNAEQAAAQGSRKLRRKKEETRKLLAEMLLLSEEIRKNAERQHEMTQALLLDLFAAIHEYPVVEL